jgi:hypothetical protein
MGCGLLDYSALNMDRSWPDDALKSTAGVCDKLGQWDKPPKAVTTKITIYHLIASDKD